MAQQNTFKNALQESKLQTLYMFSTMLSFLRENQYIKIHDTFSKRWMVGVSLVLCIRISSPTKSSHSLIIHSENSEHSEKTSHNLNHHEFIFNISCTTLYFVSHSACMLSILVMQMNATASDQYESFMHIYSTVA